MASELDAVNEMESRLIESQKRLYGMDLEKENQEEQLRSIRERRLEIESTIEVSLKRERSAVDSLSELSERRKARETDLASFTERLAEIEGNIISSQKTIAAAENRIQGNAEESSRIEDELKAEEQRREGLQDDLRTLTDDIVRELDRGLKDSGFDRSSRRAGEERIEALLNETRIHAEGRAPVTWRQTQPVQS